MNGGEGFFCLQIAYHEDYVKHTNGVVTMKKVAVIWSSPNKDGLTASAKNQFAAGIIGTCPYFGTVFCCMLMSDS